MSGVTVKYGNPKPALPQVNVWAETAGSSVIICAQHSLDSRSQNLASVTIKDGALVVQPISIATDIAPELASFLPLDADRCVSVLMMPIGKPA